MDALTAALVAEMLRHYLAVQRRRGCTPRPAMVARDLGLGTEWAAVIKTVMG